MQVIFAILLLIIATVAIVVTVFSGILKPAPTTKQLPDSILPTQTLQDTAVVPTDTSLPVLTSTITPTDTPAATFTPSPTLTRTPIPRPLPDLTVSGISDPVCTHDYRPDTQKAFVNLTINVRNIGLGSTKYYGPFSVRINLVLGQRHYSLDEWASDFNGLISVSNLQTWILNPNSDVEFKVGLELKGNTKFGIEAIANTASNPIPEFDTTNNTLTQYFSIYCQ